MPLLDPHLSEKIGTLQLLDDAIAYRLDRLNPPCQHCHPDARCAGHRHDEQLIATYQGRYAAAFRDAITGMNPHKIDQIMRRGDGTPPTAALRSTAILTRGLEIAADGTVVTELDAAWARSSPARAPVPGGSLTVITFPAPAEPDLPPRNRC